MKYTLVDVMHLKCVHFVSFFIGFEYEIVYFCDVLCFHTVIYIALSMTVISYFRHNNGGVI